MQLVRKLFVLIQIFAIENTSKHGMCLSGLYGDYMASQGQILDKLEAKMMEREQN